ncbi:hypothetical protein HY416_03785 [Candidatus Kaiserbacteria bacterium]|nr:hypothetical protein [Candidatus Kaiserbacteria bacterium]
MTENIKLFSEISKDDAASAGGKGASLGEMTQAGIPVPPGFVVLAGAFEQFLEETDLLAEIDTILHTVQKEEMHTVEHASEKIQQLILEAKMPADIAAEIEKQFKGLDTPYVAVRSSATAEDSLSAAWAGQLDSYLNTTADTLLQNVQRCWASLFTPRAIFYRFEKDLHTTKISVAVVVQKMVESEVSGIAFSVHPVTEDRNQLIIEAGFGLGEAIVSGQITPDSYVVEKNPRRIIDVSPSTQSRALYRAANGGNEWKDIAEPEASSQVLTEERILELAGLILNIENHYGFPCDIEWAFEKGTFYIVQSRPITTLSSASQATSLPLSLDPKNYTYVGLYKSPPSALWYWSSWYDAELSKELDIPEEFEAYFGLRGGYNWCLKKTEEGFKELVAAKVEAGDVGYFDSIYATLDREFEHAETFAKALGTKVERTSYEELVAHGRKLAFFCFINWQISQQFDPIFKDAAQSAGISEDAIQSYVPLPKTRLNEQHDDVVEIKKMIELKGLWELLKEDATKAISEMQSDSELQGRIDRHLKTYAWLNIQNWIGEPLTLEKLLEQMTLITSHEADPIKAAPSGFEKYVHIAERIGKLRNAGIEDFSIYMHAVMPHLEQLAERAGITYRDLLLLTPLEVFSGDSLATDMREKISRRQNDNWCVYPNLETRSVEITDDTEVIANIAERFLPKVEVSEDGSIKGQVGNKGKAIGPVRVIIATDDFHKMRPGDVLVTPMTTPDFVLLMQQAAAIVTDMGGLLCHAAIVSRELNKPCVIDTKFATQILRDGDMVEVDADNGVVRPLINEITTIDWELWIRRQDQPPFLISLWMPMEGPMMASRIGGGFTKQLCLRYADDTLWIRSSSDMKQLMRNIREFLAGQSSGALATLFATADTIAEQTPEFMKEVQRYPEEKLLSDFESLIKRVVEIAFYTTSMPYFAMEAIGTDEVEIPNAEQIRTGAEKLRATSFYVELKTKVLDRIVRAFAKKYTIDAHLVFSMTVDEMRETMKAGMLAVASSELVSRENCAHWYMGDKIVFSTDPKLMETLRNKVIDVPDDAKSTRSVKGAVAFPGKVTGTARIVMVPADMAKVRKGDILVAPTTNPTLMPALMTCGAIVTDEGGIASHAAIVSRELRKPCVVGTKYATHIIAEGDTVEVDADQGIVRVCLPST